MVTASGPERRRAPALARGPSRVAPSAGRPAKRAAAPMRVDVAWTRALLGLEKRALRPPAGTPTSPPSAGATFYPGRATLDGMAETPDRVSDPTLAELLRRLVPAYQPERVYLFGSRARGEAGPDSDYDLLLVVADDAPPERRRSRLAYEALRGTGVAADILVCTRAWFTRREGLKASLPGTILREGRLLHAA